MKTRAGGRLKTRKPQQQPISAPLITMTPFWTSPGAWTRLTAASIRTVATMATTPAATPSEPSRKLIDTCMPRTNTAVIGAASQPSSTSDGPWPPGTAKKLMVMPNAAASAPAPSSMPSLTLQGRSRMSSMSMATVMAAVTPTTCQRSGTGPPNTSMAAANPPKRARPPSRGVGAR